MCATMAECGGDGIKALLGTPLPVEGERCQPGQTTKKDGTPCPRPGNEALMLMGNTKNAGQANAAAQACEALKNKAQQECRAAGGLNTSSEQASLNAMCEAYRNGNLENFRRQLQFGDRCGVSYMECKNRCIEGAGEFGQFLQQSSQMRSAAQTCQSFSGAVSKSGSSGLASLSQAEVGRKCDEQSASRTRPQNAPGTTPGPAAGPSPGPSSNPGTQQPAPGNSNPTGGDQARKANSDNGGGGGGGMPSLPSPQSSSPYNSNAAYGNGAGFSNCTMDPSAPGCQAQQPKEQVAESGQQGGFRDADERTNEKNFNVGDTGGLNRAGYNGNGEGGAPNIPGGGGRGGAGGVPNNTGGGIPGSDGGPGARIQPQARGYAPQGGASTDIMQGFQGGGGYNYGGGGSGFDEDRRRQPQGANRAQARGPASQGMDLRQYLPGGTMDPGRRAGGFRPNARMDINAAHVNIWLKVGDRLREKCRLGLLIDCR